MTHLSWNCWGLGNPWTVRTFKLLVRDKKPNLVFLMETKLLQPKMEVIRVKLGFDSVLVVDCKGRTVVWRCCGIGMFR